jgi:hypothetical protein
MKGHTNNPNGRPKGIPNKVTADLRQWITDFLRQNLKQIKKDWRKLEPKERVIAFEKLLKYTIPVPEPTSLESKFEQMSNEELEAIVEGQLTQLGYVKSKDFSSVS